MTEILIKVNNIKKVLFVEYPRKGIKLGHYLTTKK